MLASIFGTATRPLSTPEQVDKVVSDISTFMEEQSFNTAVDVFSSLRPPDQADVMAKLRRVDQVKLLSWLTPKRLGMIVEELEPDDVIEISKDLDINHLSQVLDEISPAVAADVLRELPYEARTETLSTMKEVQDVLPLIEYEDDDAGGLMTPEFVSLSESMTVSQAMDFVRRSSSTIDINEVSFILVVDDANILKGGLNVSRLVASDPSELISEVMFPNVISVSAGTDQEECALLMEKYNLLTLPVTDSAGRLEGIVRIEDMIYVFQEEATEDMYRMVGVSDEEKILGPFWKSVRGRLPWLCVNLATAGIAAVVITIFQSTLAQVVTLAVFLPVIAGQGGIVGTQTLTLVVRSMALGEISNSNAKQLLAKEFGLGLVHGFILGILAGVVAYIWHGNQYLALVVGLAMLGNLVIAGVSGVVLPLSLRAMKVDPALASAVVVTTVTDVVGFLIYLGLATAAIGVIARSF